MSSTSKRGPACVLAPILTALRLADVALEQCADDHGSDEVRDARRALVEALPMAEAMAEPSAVYASWPASPALQISRVGNELMQALGKWPHTFETEEALRLAVARAVGSLQSICLEPREVYPRHVGRRLV